jgi:putative ABC transport system permease protein
VSWLARIRNVFRSNALSRDIDREMSFHLAERADDLAASGMRPEDARREARRRFGNYGLLKERTRERDLAAWLDTLTGDLRYALRGFRSAPGFVLVAILSLALGIGANTAIFTLIDAVVLKSLPVSHPEELVGVTRDGVNLFTNPLWEQIRDRQDMFDVILAHGEADFNLADGGEVRRVNASWISGDYFKTLGVRTVVGRPIVRDDDQRGCAGVVMLSHAFFQSEFAGDERVIGRKLSLDGHPFQIIGVVEPRFPGLEVGRYSSLYVPLCTEAIVRGANSQLDHRGSWFLEIIGRPKDGIAPEQLRSRLGALGPTILNATIPQHWTPKSKADYVRAKFGMEPAPRGFSDVRRMYSKALYVLMSIAGIVLLISCANVANLLLARATARQREVAVRLALGAGRRRLARQLITESLLLSGAGALAGVAFAAWGSRLLVGMLTRTSQVVSLDLSMDPRILAFTIAVALLTGLLFGLAPVWRAGRVDPHAAMRAHGRGTVEGHSRLSLGKALVVGQIALSLVLVASAGLLLGSWRKLVNVDTGFQRDHILLVSVDMRPAQVPAARRGATYNELLDRLRAIPGVRAASSSQVTPIGPGTWNDVMHVEGFTPSSIEDAVAWTNAVSDRYFATMGIPIVAGRDFNAEDLPGTPRVALVSRAMARKFFREETPIGKTFRLEEGPTGLGQPIRIIGVVGDTKYQSLREKTAPVVYYPSRQDTTLGPYTNLEIRTDGPATALIQPIKRAFAEINPRISLGFIPLEQQLSESLTLTRTVATLSGFFGGLALLLAIIGLYGIMAYSVARRRNEIGVRIALGAARPRVVRMVLGEVGRLVIVGVSLGVGLALVTTRLISTFLYGLTPTDARTLIMSGGLLLVVALLAAAKPAWRAAGLDPVAALREE